MYILISGLTHLMKSKGGVNTFGHSFCMRFWIRNTFSDRAASSKVRELPSDFALKLENFIRIGSRLVNEYNVPPVLCYALDETNGKFVPDTKRTRAKRGSKKTASIGIDAKAQITVTFIIKEDGTIVSPHQLIFGGKTDLCHPKIPEKDSLYHHTESHWQSPTSYIQLLEATVVKDREETIKRLNLPSDQKVSFFASSK